MTAVTHTPSKSAALFSRGRVSIRTFCEQHGIGYVVLTRLTGYSERSVAKWESGMPPSAPARKQLTEVSRLFAALCEIMQPKEIGPWLKTPNNAFEGSSPLQVIERGEGDRIWWMLYLIESGEPL